MPIARTKGGIALPQSTPTAVSKTAAYIADHITGRSCTVLGYGISNRPLVDWLAAHGAGSITVRDRSSYDALTQSGAVDRLHAAGATLICGESYLDGLSGDLIFRSPGIRPDLPPIVEAQRQGSILTSEMELFFALTPATVVAITGSDGKTTTTTLTARILEYAAVRTGRGRVFLGGNIGTPLLPLVEDMTSADIAVVELSSFQLMTLPASLVPARAALTNISVNHMDWHRDDMHEYIGAKGTLFGNAQSHPHLAVLNAGNPESRAIGEGLACPVVWFTGATDASADSVLNRARGDSAVLDRNGVITHIAADGQATPMLATTCIRLPGRHNVENFMTAIALTCTALPGEEPPATAADVKAVADVFTGVPHRLEPVGEHRGVRFYNSSIDSSPARTMAALRAMRELNTRMCGSDGTVRRDPTVICGGRDKHLPLAPLADALCTYASAVVLTGEARDAILEALYACPAFDETRLPITVIPDYREAMRLACERAMPGDTVLLSPACTSFDAFRNFEERGEVFCEIVRALASQ